MACFITQEILGDSYLLNCLESWVSQVWHLVHFLPVDLQLNFQSLKCFKYKGHISPHEANHLGPSPPQGQYPSLPQVYNRSDVSESHSVGSLKVVINI